MKKLLLFTALSLLTTAVNAQEAGQIRKMILQSDVILAGSTELRSESLNDHMRDLTFKVTELDEMIYNAGGFTTGDSVRLLQPFQDYALFWDETFELFDPVNYHSPDMKYTDLYFIRREDGRAGFVSVGSIKTVAWKDFVDRYRPMIRQMREIAAEALEPAERYARTIDWYIAWDAYPEENFIDFYRQKGVTGDTLYLTDSQIETARELFLKGNENLSEYIAGLYPAEVKEYYLRKMQRIRRIEHPEWRDLYDFRKAVRAVFDPPYRSIEYYLHKQISNDCTDTSDRERLMDYFIEKTKAALEEEP